MFEHLCNEKGGGIWRAVWIPEPSLEWAMAVAEKLERVESFIPRQNPYEVLLDPSNKFFQVDDVGMIGVFPVREWPNLLHVHITFWDKRLRGREALCRSLAMWVSRFTGKHLFTQIPEDRRVLIAFAKRAGFIEQGMIGSKQILLFTNYTE